MTSPTISGELSLLIIRVARNRNVNVETDSSFWQPKFSITQSRPYLSTTLASFSPCLSSPLSLCLIFSCLCTLPSLVRTTIRGRSLSYGTQVGRGRGQGGGHSLYLLVPLHPQSVVNHRLRLSGRLFSSAALFNPPTDLQSLCLGASLALKG